MNKIIQKNLLAADTCMPEMHLRQSGFRYSACGLFTYKKFKNLKKQKIEGTSIKTNKIEFIFKIHLKEQLRKKYYMIKHLIWVKIKNVMNIKEVRL